MKENDLPKIWSYHMLQHLDSNKYLPRSNKVPTHEALPRALWTYGIQLWGTASTSNIEILESFQSKYFRNVVDAPWYVPNTVIGRDLQASTVREEMRS
jgi:hypothetical protein